MAVETSISLHFPALFSLRHDHARRQGEQGRERIYEQIYDAKTLNILTGFHATTPPEFASAFEKALSLSPTETLAMRLRARTSAKRFTDEEFAQGFINHLEKLVAMKCKV